jgi:integrase
MARPRGDGTAPRDPNRRSLTELYVRRVRAEAAPFNVWDEKERGLVLRIHPTGRRVFKFVYSRQGRPRWYHIGGVGLSDARRIAAKVRLAVAEGKDPAAERRAERDAGTFADLAERYVEQYAKRKNRSWKHTRDKLVRPHLLPRWGKLDAKTITRADVRALMGRIEAPVLANQVKAAASAIFTWGIEQELITTNPCSGVDSNETRSRERVLSDSELPKLWRAFDSAGLIRSSALKVISLTGQRPGEVRHMRREHLVDGWWEMPGKPDHKLGWPGTKNGESHRVWLPEIVQEIVAEVDDGHGFVFGGRCAVAGLDGAMRAICAEIRVNEKATPHDLRRTHGTMITRLGFGRDAMNRIQNHKEGGIASVYDRHEYADENKRIMEAVAAHVVALVDGGGGSNVVEMRPPRCA